MLTRIDKKKAKLNEQTKGKKRKEMQENYCLSTRAEKTR